MQILHVIICKSVTLSAQFLSLPGAFQGDCLYGCLFTLIVLAGALCELRTILATTMGRSDPLNASQCLPLEIEYADDVDFIDEDEENL